MSKSQASTAAEKGIYSSFYMLSHQLPSSSDKIQPCHAFIPDQLQDTVHTITEKDGENY